MTCAEARALLDAYFDAELDLAGSLDIERHLTECATCSSALSDLERLREELTPEVFELAADANLTPLKASIRKLTRPARSRPEWPRSEWTRPALWVAIAAALVIAVFVPLRLRSPQADSAREMVDDHVRSLLANHLVDVPSSDQHTVKPWFQGKLDFAPEVPDFAEQGFALVGGRLDVVDGRPAAAIVYRRRGHFINVWTYRSDAAEKAPIFSAVDGYQTIHWKSSGMERWAVSDLNRDELQALVELLRGH
jgi:anti-sigma factor RsiW